MKRIKLLNLLIIIAGLSLMLNVGCTKDAEEAQEESITSFTDSRDGQVYSVVKIGDNYWMAENFNYNDDNAKYYDDNQTYEEIYGKLYDWETAKRICPDGWHLPTKAEWEEMININGGMYSAGENLKSGGSSNFNAVMGGCYIYSCSNGGFQNFGTNGLYWSANNGTSELAHGRILYNPGDACYSDSYNKTSLLSVRYIKD